MLKSDNIDQNSMYKRKTIPTKRQHISVVFNQSNLVLTEAMDNLLNRGLNFAILPLKMDLTQVLVDFKRFERTMVWREFF